MKRTFASLLAGATMLVPAAGHAQLGLVPGICGPVTPGAFAYVVVGSVCTNLSPLIAFNASSGLFTLAVSNLTLGAGVVNNLTVTLKPDPYISFAATTTNLVPGETTYGFFFGTLIEPGLYSRATSTGSVAVTSGPGGSATVGQNSGEEFITVFGTTGFIATPLGVDIGTGTCTAGAAPNTCNYPPGGAAENTYGPVFLDNLEVIATYTQTGLGSQATVTGRADVFMHGTTTPPPPPPSVVPEPGTVGLVLTGMVGLFGVGVVRRRTTARAS